MSNEVKIRSMIKSLSRYAAVTQNEQDRRIMTFLAKELSKEYPEITNHFSIPESNVEKQKVMKVPDVTPEKEWNLNDYRYFDIPTEEN